MIIPFIPISPISSSCQPFKLQAQECHPCLVTGLAFFALFRLSSAGNITCADSGLDWYYKLVGESPCRTYERIRQICNPSYEVPTFSLVIPPDVCNDQVHDCCCNHIAFELSMFCLNCQQGFSQYSSGYDAPKGTYQSYLTAGGTKICSPNDNQTFPTQVQTAICNKQINVLNGLYGTIWSGGDWYYVYSTEHISEKAAEEGSNLFSNCNPTNATSSLTATSTSAADTASASQPSLSSSAPSLDGGDLETSKSTLGRGAVVGIVIGAVVLLALLAIVLWLVGKERKKVDQYDDDTDGANWVVRPFNTSEYRPNNMGGSKQRIHIPTPLTSSSIPERKSRNPSQTQLEADAPDRHIDGGPANMLQRIPSGRLPPAYGQQVG